jgi:RHS repeat-associated protein
VQTRTLTSTTVITYAYGAANRLVNVDGVDYTWDANGNLLSDGVRTFTYDAANRLTSVTSGTLTTTFEYDGLGNRMAQTVDGVTTEYALDVAGGLPEVIVVTTGGGSTRYVQVQGQILAQQESDAWVYILPDHLGSVRQLVDDAGQVSLAQSYDPFGVLNSQHGTQNSQLPFGYTGEQEDAGTGLVFLRARYYDPRLGRFLTKDLWLGNPQRPLSLNLYLYTTANPANIIDPSGRFPEHICLFNWRDPCTRGRPELAPFDGYVEGIQINAASLLADNFEETFMAGVEDPVDLKKYIPVPYDPFFFSEYVGIEWTYDFVQKEWAVFAYKGSSFEGPSLGGVSLTVYNGVVNGFRGFDSPGAGLKAYEGFSAGGGGGVGISFVGEVGMGQAWGGNEQIQTTAFGVTWGAGFSLLDLDAGPFGNSFLSYYWPVRGPYPEASAKQLGDVIKGGLDISNNEFQAFFSGLPIRPTGPLAWLVLLGPDGYRGRACALRVLDWYFDTE